MEVSNCF